MQLLQAAVQVVLVPCVLEPDHQVETEIRQDERLAETATREGRRGLLAEVDGVVQILQVPGALEPVLQRDGKHG